MGDKIKVKRPEGDLLVCRGMITAIGRDVLTIRVDGTSVLANVAADNVTNFSLAARKAWQHMPKRNVGRPKGSRVSDRVSVTIRIDRRLWQLFRQAEADGVISDRTATLNSWIAEHLNRLPNTRKAS